MVSLLSLFECITCSWSLSLEEIKLVAVFQVSDFLRLFISFKYGFIKVFFDFSVFISIAITSIFNIIVTPKITHSYWFVKIFFLLKRVLKSLIILSLIASFSFFRLKRFLIFLIILFLYFQFLGFFPRSYKFLTHFPLLQFLVVFILKRLITLFLSPPTVFSYARNTKCFLKTFSLLLVLFLQIYPYHLKEC